MKKLILIIIIALQGCVPFGQDGVKPHVAEVKLYNEWLYAFKLNDFKSNSETITRPPGIKQLLFSLILPTEGGLSFKTHCVYYQVPYKKIVGKISISEQKKETVCPADSSENSWLEILEVSDLRLNFSSFTLSFYFKFKDQKIDWSFLLPNLEAGLIHEKYQPQSEKKLYPGMTFLKITEESFDSINNKYLGKLSDRMSRGSAIRCMQVDKFCKFVGENRCDDCRYGWYRVVDYNCPQGGSRFCGQNHCGEKNEPACVRGTKVVEGKDAGICQSDLSPVMNADHILICQ